MELHDIAGKPYEEMDDAQRALADEATDKTLLLGESIFRSSRQLDGRPAVMLAALTYATLRVAVEAGVTKESARKMVAKAGNSLMKLEGLEDAFESLWRAYGREER